MKRSTVEISVGLFVLVGLLCVGYLTVQFGKMEVFGSRHYALKARFNNISGLKSGARIEIAGVQVGQVDAIELDQENQMALVTLKIKNDIELTDESIYPDEEVLKDALEKSYNSYCELLKIFEENEMVWEWRYYKDGKAWLCKVQKKKKTIVWMSVWRGYMKAAVYVPERLMDQVYALPISSETKERIKETKNVGKSKPCIFEIRENQVFDDLEAIMQFKIRAK